MGRTKRKRNKKPNTLDSLELYNAFNLQKSMKLKCPNLKISYFKDTGRGIKCKRKLNSGDLLISLQINQLITTKTKCDLYSVINIENFEAQLVLSVWLVFEKHLNTDSQYFKYIESLPISYTNLYFCSELEMRLLPSFIKKEMDEQYQKINSAFKKINEVLEFKTCPHCGISLSVLYNIRNFEWAWFTVNTRSVYFHDEKNVESLALAPFLDMFNHSNDASTKVLIDFNNGLYSLQTLVNFKKHDQIFIKYGPHSNLKLLLEYGFIIPDNPHDFIEFTFQEVLESVKKFDYNLSDITKLKYNFIKGNNLNKNLTKSKEEFSWNLNGLLYILVTKDQDLSLLQSKTYSNNFNNFENEIIEKIKSILVCRKLEEFKQNLIKAQTLKETSICFDFVKSLIKIYINILESS